MLWLVFFCLHHHISALFTHCPKLLTQLLSSFHFKSHHFFLTITHSHHFLTIILLSDHNLGYRILYMFIFQTQISKSIDWKIAINWFLLLFLSFYLPNWIESPKKKGSQSKASGGQYNAPQHTQLFPGTLPINTPYAQQPATFPNAPVGGNNSKGLPNAPFQTLVTNLSSMIPSNVPPPPSTTGHDSFGLGTSHQQPPPPPPSIPGHHMDNSHTQGAILPPIVKGGVPTMPAIPGATNRSVSIPYPGSGIPGRKSSTNSHLSPQPFNNSSHSNAAQPSSHFKNGLSYFWTMFHSNRLYDFSFTANVSHESPNSILGNLFCHWLLLYCSLLIHVNCFSSFQYG